MAPDVPRYYRGIDPIPSLQLLDTLDMDTATNQDDVFVVHDPTSRDKTHSRLTRGGGRLTLCADFELKLEFAVKLRWYENRWSRQTPCERLHHGPSSPP
jgi:hypothetical protein